MITINTVERLRRDFKAIPRDRLTRYLHLLHRSPYWMTVLTSRNYIRKEEASTSTRPTPPHKAIVKRKRRLKK